MSLSETYLYTLLLQPYETYTKVAFLIYNSNLQNV